MKLFMFHKAGRGFVNVWPQFTLKPFIAIFVDDIRDPTAFQFALIYKCTFLLISHDFLQLNARDCPKPKSRRGKLDMMYVWIRISNLFDVILFLRKRIVLTSWPNPQRYNWLMRILSRGERKYTVEKSIDYMTLLLNSKLFQVQLSNAWMRSFFFCTVNGTWTWLNICTSKRR